jgi:hypothetical protein
VSASEFAHFLGLPDKPRYNTNDIVTNDIADAVCQVLTQARTDLVIVDEIHNLNLATAAGDDMSDHLKFFTEHMPAAFVYAGINVDDPDCSPGCAASRSRPAPSWCTPAPLNTATNGAHWSPPSRPRCGCTTTGRAP